MDQVHELQVLVSKLKNLEIKVFDALQISTILSKLPQFWNNYRKKIMHSMVSLFVEQFMTQIQIKCETRAHDALFHPLIRM